MESKLKDTHPLQQFHKQQIAERLKTKKRKENFFTALEWLTITLMIGGFICLIKIFS